MTNKKVVLHEYFHVYQHANLSIPSTDTDGDWRTSNRNVYFNGDEYSPVLMEAEQNIWRSTGIQENQESIQDTSNKKWSTKPRQLVHTSMMEEA